MGYIALTPDQIAFVKEMVARKNQKRARAKIEIDRGSGGYWWRLVGGNGKIICSSETFPTRGNAVRAAKRAVVVMQQAEIVND